MQQSAVYGSAVVLLLGDGSHDAQVHEKHEKEERRFRALYESRTFEEIPRSDQS